MQDTATICINEDRILFASFLHALPSGLPSLVSINHRLLELGEQNLKLGYLGVFAEIIEQALNLSMINGKHEGFHHFEELFLNNNVYL